VPAKNDGEKNPPPKISKWNRSKNKKATISGLSAFIHTYRNEQEANRAQEGREDRGKKWREIWTLIFVILTTGGIFYQAHILNNSDTTFKETLISQQETSKRQLRAHVLFESVNITPSGAIFVRFKNSGQTPAYNLTHWWKAEVFFTPGFNGLNLVRLQTQAWTLAAAEYSIPTIGNFWQTKSTWRKGGFGTFMYGALLNIETFFRDASSFNSHCEAALNTTIKT
jgi:hypothetical protein